MNLNLDAILQSVQDFRSQLEIWGVNSQGLAVVGGIAAVLFVLSLREVATWFFRVNKVRDEVRSLRVQMNAMQKAINETRDILLHGAHDAGAVPLRPEELLKIANQMRDMEEPTSGKKKDAGSSTKFRLDH